MGAVDGEWWHIDWWHAELVSLLIPFDSAFYVYLMRRLQEYARNLIPMMAF